MEDRDDSGGETTSGDAPDPGGELPEETTALPPVPPSRRFPSSNIGRPRVEGVEAGVAAGLVPSSGSPGGRAVPGAAPRHLAPGDAGAGGPVYSEEVSDEIAEGIELPDWTDPPTREVPRVLLRPGEEPTSAIRGPVWRESERDWEGEDEIFAEIVSGSVPIVAHDEQTDEEAVAYEAISAVEVRRVRVEAAASEPTPAYDRGADDEPSPRPRVRFAGRATSPPVGGPAAATDGDGGEADRSLSGDSQVRPRVRFAGRAAGGPAAPGPAAVPATAADAAAGEPGAKKGRNPVVATVTGLAIGGVALLFFLAGPAAVLAIASLVLLLAAAEAFQTLRRARLQPATLLGLVAAPGFAVAAYLKGIVALPVVTVLAVVATLCWYLVGVSRHRIVASASATLLVIAWVAGLGAFAGLLLDPTAFPAHHGVAYLLGAVEATVAYDVGGYAFGSLFGRHKLAPEVSPNKTWEGLIGGCVAAIVVALAITSQMHPWTLPHAALLGVVVAVVAPIGDLAESMIKRDLRVKDMGSLLPAHGGVLDRIDALLFVLPATYYLVRLFHG